MLPNAAAHLSAGGRFVIELTVPELRALPPGRDATVFAPNPVTSASTPTTSSTSC